MLSKIEDQNTDIIGGRSATTMHYLLIIQSRASLCCRNRLGNCGTRKDASLITCCVIFNITYILANKNVNEELSRDDVLDRMQVLHGSHRYSIMEYCRQNHLSLESYKYFGLSVPYLLINSVRFFIVVCLIASSS